MEINKFKTEQEFVDVLAYTFGKHFKVTLEVWSKCKNGRIDILLTYKDKYYFGIECKQPNRKRGEEIGEFVKQAIRYSDYEFQVENGVYKKIPIFICPALSYHYFILNDEVTELNGKKWHKDRHDSNFSHHSFNGFLGTFGIGEVRKSGQNYYFSVSNSTIWKSNKIYGSQEIEGINEANYVKLAKKLGL
jgi:hypothetical protein